MNTLRPNLHVFIFAISCFMLLVAGCMQQGTVTSRVAIAPSATTLVTAQPQAFSRTNSVVTNDATITTQVITSPTVTATKTATPVLPTSTPIPCQIQVDLNQAPMLAIEIHEDENYSSLQDIATEAFGIYTTHGFEKRNLPKNTLMILTSFRIKGYRFAEGGGYFFPLYRYNHEKDWYEKIQDFEKMPGEDVANIINFQPQHPNRLGRGYWPFENLRYIVVGEFVIKVAYDEATNSSVFADYSNMRTNTDRVLGDSIRWNYFATNPAANKLLYETDDGLFKILDLETGQAFEFQVSTESWTSNSAIFWSEAGILMALIDRDTRGLHVYTITDPTQLNADAKLSVYASKTIEDGHLTVDKLSDNPQYIVTNTDGILQFHDLVNHNMYLIRCADAFDYDNNFLAYPISSNFVDINGHVYALYLGWKNKVAGTYIIDVQTGQYDFVADYVLIAPAPPDLDVAREIPIVTTTPFVIPSAATPTP